MRVHRTTTLPFPPTLSYPAPLVGPHYTRVAVVQIAYHPAIVANFRSPLEDPLWDPKRGDSLEPAQGQLADELEPELNALRKRIRGAYDEQLLAKVQAILATCRRYSVRLVVFPEYSISWEILGGVADAAGDMVVVAGSHSVDLAAEGSGIYQRLVASYEPSIGQSVCPVLHQGRLLALVPKLNPAEPERESMISGEAWAPVVMPDGFPGPMGVLICLDFLFRESERYRAFVAERIGECRFLVVPSLTPHYTLPEFAGKAWEEARRYKRPVLYCDIAVGGGTALYVDEGAPSELRHFPERAGYLDPGDEGVIIADVNLGYERGGPSTPYDSPKPVKPIAEATLVYQTNPTSVAYAQWLENVAQVLGRNGNAALKEMVARIKDDRASLLDAGALSGAKARDRRLRKLVQKADKLMSVEQIRQLVGEIVLPPDVLPLDIVRNAMAGAAADVIFEWLKRREAKAAEFGEVEERLRKASDTGKSQPSLPETLSAIAAITEAVRGPKEPETLKDAPAPDVKVVLPKGIDPAALGDQEVGGFKFAFRRRASDFQPARVDHAKVGDVWSATVSAPFLEAEIWAAEGFCQLATAEGAERVAVLGVAKEDPSGPRGLLALSSRGDAWVLWSGNIASTLVQHRDAIIAALGGFGLHIVATEHLTVRQQGERVHALLPIIDGAKPAIQKLRDRRLEEVNAQFEEPFVRVDGNAQTLALGALTEWLDSGWPAALVLGEFGSGKSTVLAVWAEQRWNRESGPKPILVDLAGALPGRDPESLLLDTVGVSDSPTHRAALRLLIRYRFVVPCFDGFDEIATRLGATELEGRLSALFEVARGGPGQVLVSCRSNYFATEEHLSNTTQRALQNIGSSAKPRRIELVLFDSNQVEHLIRNVCEVPEKAEQALEQIANTYNLQDLVKRPLLLGMVVRLLGQLDTSSRVGTADLYEAYLTRWLRQTHSGDPECFTDEQKIEFGEALAEQLWRTGQPSCSWQDLQKSVRARLAQYLPEDIPLGPAFQEIQGGAFFVREGDDRFRFAHKSFLEYFLARAFCRTVVDRPVDVLSTKPITREVAAFVGEILRREGDPKHSNVVKVVQQFLLSGRTSALESTAEAAANALRLLHSLAKWSTDAAGWIPEGAHLQKVSLVRADLRDAVLVAANLSDADLSCADFSGADLTNARLEKARFAATKLFGTRLVNVNAKSADFLHAEADKANLEGADLRDATLRQSMWTRCRWEGAKFDGADVTVWAAPGIASEKPGLATLALDAQHGLLLASSRASNPAAIQPSGLYLACADWGGTNLWHTTTGKQLTRIAHDSQHITSRDAWHPFMAVVVTANARGVVHAWDAVTGKLLAKLDTDGSDVTHMAWNSTGSILAAAGRDGSIFLVNRELSSLGSPLIHANGPETEAVSDIAWHPSDDVLASVGPSGCTILWLIKEGRKFKRLDSPLDTTALAWQSDGIHLLCGNTVEAAVIDSYTGQIAAWMALKSDEVSRFKTVAWSSIGKLAATDDDSVEVFDVLRKKSVKIFDLPSVDLFPPIAAHLTWHPDGRHLLCTGSTGVLFDAVAGKESSRLEVGEHDSAIVAIIWHPDGINIIALQSSGHAGVWDSATGRQIAAHLGPVTDIFSMLCGPGTQVATENYDGSVFIWDAITGEKISTLHRSVEFNQAIAWHPSGTKLASVEARQITLWDATSGAAINHTDRPFPEPSVMTWHPDGKRLLGAAYDVMHIWDAETGKNLGAIDLRHGAKGLACHPDGIVVACASSDGIVHVWDIVEHRKVSELKAHQGEIHAVAWHPAGTQLAVAGDDGFVTLWDAGSFAIVARFLAHDGEVRDLAWHASGLRLASGGEDAMLKIWDPVALRLLCTFSSTRVSSLARTPGGFCRFGDGDASAFRLSVRRPEENSRTELYLPLGGLREVLHRPDKVAAALAGDLSGDDLGAELARLGWDNGVVWDGEIQRAPEDAKAAGSSPLGQK